MATAFSDVDGSVEYLDAGLIRRGLAYWLDATIAGLIFMPLFLGSAYGLGELGSLSGMSESSSQAVAITLGVLAMQFGLFVAFIGIPLKMDGQTLGQKVLSIVVLSQEGTRPSTKQIVIRGLAKLFIIQACLPFAVASVLMFRQSVASFGWKLGDGKPGSNRFGVAVHDKIAKTVAVVAKKARGA